MKSQRLLSVGAVIFMLVLVPATADAQRGGGRSHGGHGVRSVGGSGVVVGGPVVRGTVVRPVAVKPNVIVRQPIVAGSVPARHFGRIGFGTVPVRTGFGTVPVRTGFEVAPVGTGFVHMSGGGFVHAGTGFVHSRPVPGRFVNGSRDAFASKGFREHRGRFVRGGVVGYPVYPYYPFYSYPYVYPQYDYPTAPEYFPLQTYGSPQTYGGDYGAGGVSAGLSTYFMELGNQNRSGLTFEVSPMTTEVFVDGVYVGIVQDFSAGRALTVVPGTHRIDLQAAGYRPLAFDVALTAGQVVPYQGQLQPLGPY